MNGTVKINGTLSGSLGSVTTLSGSLSPKASLFGALKVHNEFEYTAYEGDMTATPSSLSPVTLDTAGKVMLSDFVIEQITYTEVANPSGGTTVIIS